MSWVNIRTLDELRQLEPPLYEAVTRKSKDFFLPKSPNVYWEVERKPYFTDVLKLRPNKPVNRAWDFLFRVILYRIAPDAVGTYQISPQAEPPFTGLPDLYIELPDTDRAASRQAVQAINSATTVANALTAEAAKATEREHEVLARDLGLERPRPGF